MRTKKTDQQQAPVLPELTALASEAAVLETPDTAAGGGIGDIPPDTPAGPIAPGAARDDPAAQQAAMWSMIPRTVGAVFAMAMPELREVYTEEACSAWGEAMLPVARKYGWNLDGDVPELALLAASTPFIIGTGMAILKRRQIARAAPPAQPGGKADTTAPAGRGGVMLDAAPPNINA